VRAAMVGAALGMLARYPREAMAAARSACHLWANGVMPALFPYMVLSQLLLPAVKSPLLLAPLAMLGGSPSGARLINLSGCTAQKAQRLAALCATASPLFILGTLQGGVRMLLAHWLGACVAWAFVYILKRPQNDAAGNNAAPSPPARMSLTETVRDAALAMITVCGCMALFSVLTALLSRAFPLSAALSALLAALLEMATGCARIEALGLSAQWTAALLCAAVSFGGFSVFTQNAMFLRPAGVTLRLQLAARAVHAASALFICYRLYTSF